MRTRSFEQTPQHAAPAPAPVGLAAQSSIIPGPQTRVRQVRAGLLLALALGLSGSGCVVGRAAGAYSEIPRERTTECQEICTKLDLQMAAVVVVLNTTGCVCEPRTARAPATPVSSLASPAEESTRKTTHTGGAAVAAAQAVATVMAQQQQRVLR